MAEATGKWRASFRVTDQPEAMDPMVFSRTAGVDPKRPYAKIEWRIDERCGRIW